MSRFKRPLLIPIVRGRRGRRGRKGCAGMPPRHEWSEDGTRVRFEISTGEWGQWSAPLAATVHESTESL